MAGCGALTVQEASDGGNGDGGGGDNPFDAGQVNVDCSIASGTIVEGQQTQAVATVTNNNDQSAKGQLAIKAGGTTLETQQVNVAANSSQETAALVGDSLPTGNHTMEATLSSISSAAASTARIEARRDALDGVTPFGMSRPETLANASVSCSLREAVINEGSIGVVEATVTNNSSQEIEVEAGVYVDGNRQSTDSFPVQANDQLSYQTAARNLDPGTYSIQVQLESVTEVGDGGGDDGGSDGGGDDGGSDGGGDDGGSDGGGDDGGDDGGGCICSGDGDCPTSQFCNGCYCVPDRYQDIMTTSTCGTITVEPSGGNGGGNGGGDGDDGNTTFGVDDDRIVIGTGIASAIGAYIASLWRDDN